MASHKTENVVGQGIIAELNNALAGCEMSARGFFFAIVPLLEEARCRGFLEMDAEQLAHYFRTSVHHTRRYIAALRRHGVLRRSTDGILVCPLVVRRWMQP